MQITRATGSGQRGERFGNGTADPVFGAHGRAGVALWMLRNWMRGVMESHIPAQTRDKSKTSVEATSSVESPSHPKRETDPLHWVSDSSLSGDQLLAAAVNSWRWGVAGSVR